VVEFLQYSAVKLRVMELIFVAVSFLNAAPKAKVEDPEAFRPNARSLPAVAPWLNAPPLMLDPLSAVKEVAGLDPARGATNQPFKETMLLVTDPRFFCTPTVLEKAPEMVLVPSASKF